jgi:hypothetical protein
MRYRPVPIDTAHVTLTPEILDLVERLSRNVHETWAQQRLAEGWRYGRKRNDTRKEHPCLIPYEELSEEEREIDRHVAMQVVKGILAYGYRIELPE